MSEKIKYTDEDIGDVRVIPDFLPPPADLAFREEAVKVTMTLSKKSVEFFKAEASKHQTQYQRMIRQLLDLYVDAHGQQQTERKGMTKSSDKLAKPGDTEKDVRPIPRRRSQKTR